MNEEAHLLNSAQFDHYWPLISQEMDRVKHLWEIWWTKESIHRGVMEGWLNVWVVGDKESIHLTIFTQMAFYPANTILKIVLLFGNDLDRYYDIAEATIEKFALDRGCQYMETLAREGFRRRIKGASYHGAVLTRKVGTTKVQ